MQDVMLDLETLGASPQAVILQIGACYFEPGNGVIGRTFNENISLENSLANGFKIDAATLKWWLDQSWDAIDDVIVKDGTAAGGVLLDLNFFLHEAKTIWCHTTFDAPILMNYYRTLSLTPVFHYKAFRDIRTLLDLVNFKSKDFPADVGTAHTALDDCKYQVAYVSKCIQRIMIERG